MLQDQKQTISRAERSFELYIKSLAGETISIRCSPDDTVLKLKLNIYKKIGMSISSQRLIAAGKQLRNDGTLREYNLQKEDEMFLVRKLSSAPIIASSFSSNSSSLPGELWVAGSMGDAERIKALRGSKVDFNVQSDEGDTALHYAAIGGHTEVIPLLIGNYNIRNNEGETPIQLAARYNQRDMMQNLMDAGVELEGVLHTLARNSLELLRHFLAASSPYRERLLAACPGGIRALIHTAIESNRIDIIEFLIKYDPSSRSQLYDEHGLFHEAVMAGDENTIDVLFRLYVDPSKPDKSKLTPAELATQLFKSNPDNYKLKRLIDQLNHFSEVRKKQNKDLQQNADDLIKSIQGELIQNKAWDFLKRKDSERRAKFEAIMREYFLEDLSCQQLLCVPDPDVSKLTAHLVANILQDQPLLLKKINLSERLVEESLRKVINESLQNFKDKPENKSSESTMPRDKTGVKDSTLMQEPKELPEPPAAPIVSTVEERKKTKKAQMQPLSREQEEFIGQFESTFDDAYCKFHSLRNGAVMDVPDSADRIAGVARTAAEAFPRINLPVPGLTVAVPTKEIAVAAIDIGMYFRDRWRKEKAERMCNFFQACRPSERTEIVRLAATCIAEKYRLQLAHLESGTEGVSRFAVCAAQRVIDYIISNDSNVIQKEASTLDRIGRWLESCWSWAEIPSKLTIRKSLLSVFLDGMLRVTNYPGDTALLRTVGGSTHEDQWVSKGIIENTGILTPEGEYLAHTNCRLDMYGYVYGTKEEATKRGLTPKGAKGGPWDRGRVWQSTQETAESSSPPTELLATRHLIAATQSGQTFISSARPATSSASSSSSSLASDPVPSFAL